jgi:hypothetical protein
MSMIFQSTVAHTLKKTLQSVVTDDTDGLEKSLYLSKWVGTVEDMDDAYVDDLIVAGPGLAREVTEGDELPSGTIREHTVTRYIARKFGLKLQITEEAMEDDKYPQSIKLARFNKRALFKTADIDATNILIRGWNSSYVGADGVSLFSASHTLAQGGTFSNTMATPMSPSRAAFIVAATFMKKLPGHDGVIEGYEPKGIVCPVAQWAVWRGICGSEKAPEAGEFNEINVVNADYDLKVTAIPYWSNSDTNYAYTTSANDEGVKFLWRRRATSKTWVENSQEAMSHSISARWSRGWTDPRGMYGVQA